MKKWLIMLLLLPTLCFAEKTNPPWEQMKGPNGNGNGYMYRMSVPHGWIVYTWLGGVTSPSTIFVPDDNHEWVLEK